MKRQASLKTFFSPQKKATAAGDAEDSEQTLWSDSEGEPTRAMTWAEAGAVQRVEGNLECEPREYTQRGMYQRIGGRRPNHLRGLEFRGRAGGWGSNRLYSGMERRRHDWTAAERVEICRAVNAMKAAGSDAAEGDLQEG